MNTPTLQSLTAAFTQATVSADGFPTAFHAGTAAVVNHLVAFTDQHDPVLGERLYSLVRECATINPSEVQG